VQPVASAGSHIICPQAVVYVCVQPVLQPHAEHGAASLVCGSVYCTLPGTSYGFIDGGLG
jgi:hypothetical protein